MRITVTARHTQVTDELRARARELVDRLARVAIRPQSGQVLFGGEHGLATVEIRLTAARGGITVARAEAQDLRSALDLAASRVRRQLDKSPAKRSGPARRRAAARAER